MTTRHVLVLVFSIGCSACKSESHIPTWVDGYCSQLSVDIARRAKTAAPPGDRTAVDVRRALAQEFHRELMLCLNTRDGSIQAHAPLEQRETDAITAYGESNDPAVLAKVLADLATVAEEIRSLPIAK